MTEYSGWMKDDLVNELHTRGLDATGTKADLVQRLTEDDAEVEPAPEQVTAPLPPDPVRPPEPEPVAPPAPPEEPRGAFPGETAEIAESVSYVASQGVQAPGIFGGVDTS